MTYPFRDAFAELIDPRFYSIGWLDRELETGRAKLWSDGKAAIIAAIHAYPTGAKEVHGICAAGELDSIVSLIPLAEQWGREHGCIVAVIESREGWGRVLKDYTPYQISVRKEL